MRRKHFHLRFHVQELRNEGSCLGSPLAKLYLTIHRSSLSSKNIIIENMQRVRFHQIKPTTINA